MKNNNLFLLVFLCCLASSSAFSTRYRENSKTLTVKATRKLSKRHQGEPTGFSPKKAKPKWIALDSPLKKKLKIKAKVDNEEATVIDGTKTDFSSGTWCFVDPYVPSSSLAVSADFEGWEDLVQKYKKEFPWDDELIDHFNREQFEEFLVNLAHFIHDNILNIDKFAIRSAYEEGPVCRHFATYTAVLFSKLLNNFSPKWHAFIQLVGANIVESDISFKEDGHAWNLVSVLHGENIYYWLYDVLHHTIVPLDSKSRLSKLKKHVFLNREKVKVKNIKKDSLFYNTVSLTLDRFNIVEWRNSIYSDDNMPAWQQLSVKAASNIANVLDKKEVSISRKRKPEQERNTDEHRVARRKLDF